MNARILSFVVTGILAAASGARSAEPDLSLVKSLYASASYEEALSALDRLEAADHLEAIEQYRALCLLGLGRTEDAERSLERIVASNPLYTMPVADVSPRLVTLFRDVRVRSLPAAARDLYARAKTSYDKEDFEEAARRFKDLVALGKDPEVNDEGSSLAELRQLAEGFLTLTEAALAKAAAPPPPPAATARPKPAAEPPRYYTSADRGVSPPGDLQPRTLPRWVPPNQVMARMSFRGRLELIIDEEGLVESAVLSKSVAPFYDQLVVEAAKKWRFRPARKDGAPVKYLLAVDVVLTPAISSLATRAEPRS